MTLTQSSSPIPITATAAAIHESHATQLSHTFGAHRCAHIMLQPSQRSHIASTSHLAQIRLSRESQIAPVQSQCLVHCHAQCLHPFFIIRSCSCMNAFVGKPLHLLKIVCMHFFHALCIAVQCNSLVVLTQRMLRRVTSRSHFVMQIVVAALCMSFAFIPH